GIGGGRVEHGLRLGDIDVVEGRGADGQRVADEVAPDEHQGDARRPGVFLGARIDHAGARKIDGTRKNVRGSVDDQGHVGRAQAGQVGPLDELDPAYGFVAAQVHISRIAAHTPGFSGGKPGKGRLPDAVKLGGFAAAGGGGDVSVAAGLFV